MKRHWRKIAVVLIVVATMVLIRNLLPEANYLNLARVKEHRDALLALVRDHYLQAVVLFSLLYLATALFLPGALALTVAAGMMFGTLPAVLYVILAATSGATIAFLAARFLIGGWVEARYGTQLIILNRELEARGYSYLLFLRILPVVPFFVINYGAGLTKVRLRTFVWTTSIGMLPGTFIYTYAGQQLGKIGSSEDVASGKIFLALILLSLFTLLPVLLHHLPSRKG